MVPLVKDSLSYSTGLPTLFRRAKCLYLMLDLCYLSMKPQLKTSNTCGTRWVIFSIPACGHKLNRFFICHPIQLLTRSQLLLSVGFEISIVVDHEFLWERLMGIILAYAHWHTPKWKNCLCHCVTPKMVPYYICAALTQSSFATPWLELSASFGVLWLGFAPALIADGTV